MAENLIHGESYKPIVAEAATKAATKVYNRIMITHLLTDEINPNRIAGAVGFHIRDGAFYIFRARRTVIVASGGGTHIFRPRSVGEGAGRTWYAPWSTGSRVCPNNRGRSRDDSDGKQACRHQVQGWIRRVGAWFLALKAVATNAYGEDYELRYPEDQRTLYGNYVDSKPFPTCLRNDAMLREIKAGRQPIYIHTERVLDTREKEELGHEDFLDMTMSQTIVWASQNIYPKKRPSELQTSEPYIMGSHATCSGAWASGPQDVSPKNTFGGTTG